MPFRKCGGSFIINDSPVISIQDAKGGTSNATAPEDSDGNIFGRCGMIRRQ
jgi:hypothetical protein